MADTEEPKKFIPPEQVEASDPVEDKAVDDIMKHDGDEVLQVQDESAAKAVVMKQGPWERFKNFNRAWWNNPKKRWGTVAGIVVVLAVVFGLPFTRYNALGLAMKAPVTVQVVDSKNGEPVSGATVELAGKKALTDGEGKVTLKVNAGSKTLKVTKSYYQGVTQGELVTLSGGSNHFKAKVLAQGRQVKVKVVNKVTGKPVSGAQLKAGSATAKTNKDGLATLVTPSSSDTQAATVSLGGYNDATVTVAASGNIAKNTFQIIPAGKLYFLSNLSGTIDVVKTNLDGSDRKTVLAGTGDEDRYGTSLLASRDWKYLALLSKRSGSSASVYFIDTTNGDKLTTIDQGNADFSLVGWSGDRFIYKVDRKGLSLWQANQHALKSFDASSGQTTLLDQSQAAGISAYNYTGQQFDYVALLGNQVVYAKNWHTGYQSYDNYAEESGGKSAELDSINADGSAHKVIKSFALGQGVYLQSVQILLRQYEPNEISIDFPINGKEIFYVYADDKVADDSDMTTDSFYREPYLTYLLSPSGNQTFWADSRDGKYLLSVGNQDAKNKKQVGDLGDYSAYGWYTDDYLLVSKGGSELYVLGKGGGTPLKIADYYRPSGVNYQGYGGGYGGL
jgi:DNA/RNA endonuclease YhcR with UshA esterase domain